MTLKMLPDTKRNLFLCALLFFAIVETIFLPVSFGSSKWVVIDTFRSFRASNTSGIVELLTTTSVGVFRSCDGVLYHERCIDNEWSDAPLFPFDSCKTNQRDFGDRLNATGAFMIMAFIASIISLLISIVHFYVDNFGEKNFALSSWVILMIRAAFSAICLLCTFISICVFGSTISSWSACGEHLCNKLTSRALLLGLPSEISEKTCGYGYSFGLAIVCMLCNLFYLLLVVGQHLSSKEPRVQSPSLARPKPAETHISPVRNPSAMLVDSKSVDSKANGNALPAPNLESTTANADVAPTFLPQGEDWEYDADAKLYWSPTQELYFDDSSGHFYDPESLMWYNPQTSAWYHM